MLERGDALGARPTARGLRRPPIRRACAARCRDRAGRRRADRRRRARYRTRGRGSSRRARPSARSVGATRSDRPGDGQRASPAPRRARAAPARTAAARRTASAARSPRRARRRARAAESRDRDKHDADVVGRGPGRPPVDDRRAQSGARGDFPERRNQPLVARRDGRARQPQQVGRRRERRPDAAIRCAAGRRARRPGAIRARGCRVVPAAAPSRSSSTRAPDRGRRPTGIVATLCPSSRRTPGSRPAARRRSSVATSTPSIAMTTTRWPVGTTVSAGAAAARRAQARVPRTSSATAPASAIDAERESVARGDDERQAGRQPVRRARARRQAARGPSPSRRGRAAG